MSPIGRDIAAVMASTPITAPAPVNPRNEPALGHIAPYLGNVGIRSGRPLRTIGRRSRMADRPFSFADYRNRYRLQTDVYNLRLGPLRMLSGTRRTVLMLAGCQALS